MPYNNLERKHCENCGQRFQPTSGRQIFCTDCGIAYRVRRTDDFNKFGESLAMAVFTNPECIRCGSISLQEYDDGDKICITCGKLQSRPD